MWYHFNIGDKKIQGRVVKMKPTIRDLINCIKLNTIIIMDKDNIKTILDTSNITEDILIKEISGFVLDGFTRVRVWLREDD